MLRSDDDAVPSTPTPNAFRPSVEALETRESPAIISFGDLYQVRSGRVLVQTNLPPFPTKFNQPFTNRGVLGNDFDDTRTPVPQFLVGLSARLISTPIEVSTGIAVTTPFAFNDSGKGSFRFRAPRNFNGLVSFQYQAFNAAGTNGPVTTVTINVQGPIRRTAVGAGEGGAPRVDVWDSSTKTALFSFYAYDQAFTGGVRVATGDFNGDNVDDIVTVPGKGGAPNLRIFDGKTGDLIQSFYALDPNFTGGLNIATGDVNGDDRDDIVLGADRGGGPRVTVLDGNKFTSLADFYAFDQSFTGGVRVAVGDVKGTGNGLNSIVVAPGFGGAPNVRQFDLSGGSVTLTRSFYAGDPNDARGLNITVGDYNGDYTDDFAVGSGAGNAEVRVYSGIDLSLYFNKDFGDQQQLPIDEGADSPTISARQSALTVGLTTGPGAAPISLTDTAVPPLAGTLQGFSGGVRVATTYANRDDNADLILASGPNVLPEVTILGGGGGNGGLFQATLADFVLFGGKFYGGLFPTGHQ
jgi:hypothetical protein